jgi:phosphoglycolate phosphatase-like HAD superfamily hydrolase
MRRKLLFLDFDGVICDSINECFVSSRHAYYQGLLNRKPDDASAADKETFARIRPFIRSGEDYVLIQKLIDQNVEVTSQEDFDRELTRAGEKTMEHYKAVFYDAREELIRRDKQYWLSLSKPFDHVKDFLPALSRREEVYIISTKRSAFVQEITGHWNLSWPIERILYPGTREKPDIIMDYVPECGYSAAILVEDQIDHLLKCRGLPIQGILAEWGYIKEAWLSDTRVESMDRRAFRDFLASFLKED